VSRTRASRFDAVTPATLPERFVNLAERRVGGMVAAWSWQQEYSSALPGAPPRLTLLDVVVSAYVQGATDVVDTACQRALFIDREAADAARDHLRGQW
jgi:hypothetical protein